MRLGLWWLQEAGLLGALRSILIQETAYDFVNGLFLVCDNLKGFEIHLDTEEFVNIVSIRHVYERGYCYCDFVYHQHGWRDILARTGDQVWAAAKARS